MGGQFSFLSLFLFIALPLGYIVLQVWALRRWEGVWKRTAWLGLASAIGLILWVAVGFVIGSDVWPLPLLLGVPVLFASFVVLSVAHAVLNRKSQR